MTEQKKRVEVCFMTDPNFNVRSAAIPTDRAATTYLESRYVQVRIRSDFDINI
jgi:hypothetical protein